jgi:outer membrane protein
LVKKEEFVKSRIFIALLTALFVVSMVSVTFAADNSFKKYGVRIRGIYIMPDEKVDGALEAALGGAKINVADAVAPELDLEYFATKNFSAELVLALSKHDIEVNGNDLGHVWLLPPSLFVKYHPLPDAKISPYVGFGMNVVMPFDEQLAGFPDFKVDTTVGWAAKVGADIPIGNNVYLNIDAMYYDTETKMTAAGAKWDLDINPFIIGTGIGVRF